MTRWVGAVCATTLIAITLVSPSAAYGLARQGHLSPQVGRAAPMWPANPQRDRAAITPFLTSLGVDRAHVTLERGARNYAGPTCPGKGWTCTKSTMVVQEASNHGVNRAYCSGRSACVVVQVAQDKGANAAYCVRVWSATQSCTIAQSSTAGDNNAVVIEKMDRYGGSQSAVQSISIDQSNGSGNNCASVLQRMSLFSWERSSEVVSQTIDAHQSIAISQDSGSGSNTVGGLRPATALSQSETVDENATSSAGVTQLANATNDGPNMAIAIGQNQGTPTATGANTSAFVQANLLTAGAVTPTGPVIQTESSPGGGLDATVDQYSSGVSASSASQSETQLEQAATTHQGSVLPAGTVQTEYGPVRCCSLQGTNSADTFSVAQSTTQCAGTFVATCTTGMNDDADLFNVVNGSCETSGNCGVGQQISVDDSSTNNSQSGSNVDTSTTCTGETCVSGESPTVAIGPVCVDGPVVAFNGTVNWKGQAPGSITIDWGDGDVEQSATLPDAHTYATPGTYPVTVTAAGGAGSGQATISVRIGTDDDTCSYSFKPAAPIAAPGSLSPGESTSFSVEVEQDGQPLNGIPVWLAFFQGTGGGGATGCCQAADEATPLTGHPQMFVSGANGAADGTVSVVYTTPLLCSNGTDVVEATDTGSSTAAVGQVVIHDDYQYECGE